MNMKITKPNILKKLYMLSLLVGLVFFSNSALSQDNPYSEWALKEVPKSYENIKAMVEKVWGDDDDKRNAYMIELHCRSLNIMLTKMQSEDANWDVFGQAIEKWSLSVEGERSENWWEWADTNWMKVESEYRILLESKN